MNYVTPITPMPNDYWFNRVEIISESRRHSASFSFEFVEAGAYNLQMPIEAI
jgi:hypothetical protein